MTFLMKRKDFEQLVREAISALPEHAKAAMENVNFAIEGDARRPPSLKLPPSLKFWRTSRRASKKANETGIRVNEELLGLYEGISKIERGANYFGVLPDKITIFQKPIEELGNGEIGKIKKLVREVVWHEVGHHLGFNEKEIRALEAKKKILR